MKKIILSVLIVCLGWTVSAKGKWQELKPSTLGRVMPAKTKMGNGRSRFKVQESYGKIPLYFIPNQGQVDSEAKFYARTSAYTLWLTPRGLVFDSQKREPAEKPRDKEIIRETCPKCA